MALTWGSIGHAFASSFTAVAKGAEWLGGEIAKINNPTVQKTVEDLTALIPVYGGPAVKLEQYAFAGLGLVSAGLHYGGAAFEKNLLDNGADQAAIDEIKDLIKQFPNIISDIEAVFGKPGAAKTAAQTAAVQSVLSTATQPMPVTGATLPTQVHPQ